jgi:hypothetical protein
MVIQDSTGVTNEVCYFDASAGTLSWQTNNDGGTASIRALPEPGWFRCTLSWVNGSGANKPYVGVYISNSPITAHNQSYTGDGVSYCTFGAAQLEIGGTATAIILGTTGPTTVTDYVLVNSNQIVTGATQVPVAVAVFGAPDGVKVTFPIATPNNAIPVVSYIWRGSQLLLPTDYTVTNGQVTFAVAPLAGTTLTWTGSYPGGPATGSTVTWSGSGVPTLALTANLTVTVS